MDDRLSNTHILRIIKSASDKHNNHVNDVIYDINDKMVKINSTISKSDISDNNITDACNNNSIMIAKLEQKNKYMWCFDIAMIVLSFILGASMIILYQFILK